MCLGLNYLYQYIHLKISGIHHILFICQKLFPTSPYILPLTVVMIYAKILWIVLCMVNILVPSSLFAMHIRATVLLLL